MKLDKDPRIGAVQVSLPDLLIYLRKVSQVVNDLADKNQAQAQKIADLEARVAALETP